MRHRVTGGALVGLDPPADLRLFLFAAIDPISLCVWRRRTAPTAIAAGLELDRGGREKLRLTLATSDALNIPRNGICQSTAVSRPRPCHSCMFGADFSGKTVVAQIPGKSPLLPLCQRGKQGDLPGIKRNASNNGRGFDVTLVARPSLLRLQGVIVTLALVNKAELSTSDLGEIPDTALLLHQALPETGYASQRALNRLALFQAKSRAFGMVRFLQNVRRRLGRPEITARTVPPHLVRDIGLAAFQHGMGNRDRFIFREK